MLRKLRDGFHKKPVTGCETWADKNPHGGRCRCVYIAVTQGVNDG